MFRLALVVVTLAVAGSLAACASKDSSAARGQEVRVRYAEVVEIDRVKLPSNAPAGAMIGGFTGLVLSRKSSGAKQVASGVGGAVLGGLATAALEGDRMGYSYRLRFRNGDTSNFITEKGYLQVGDCVSVERGEYANIRRVAAVLCEESPGNGAESLHLRQAEQCHAAKDQLLAASTSEQIEAAARKVAILCEH